jgi:hypothetical protein
MPQPLAVTPVTALAIDLAQILAKLAVIACDSRCFQWFPGPRHTRKDTDTMDNDDAGRHIRRVAPVTRLHGERPRLITLSDRDLRAILDRHLNWVASGWELGQCAHLQRADLHGADLRNVNLQNADLNQTCLQRADLAGADLRGADLRDADLSGANLEGADLTAADLAGAVLTRARGLTQAQVEGAFCDGATVIPPGLKIREALREAN